jgi:apolipoprotein N-acyltransferase
MRSSSIIESGELIIMVLRRLALGTSVGSFLGRKQTSLATLGVAAVSCACAATTTSTPPTMGRGRRFGGRQAAAMCTGSDSQRTSVHVALCQTKVTADKGLNIATAREAVRAAASKGAELIILPEIWNGPYATTAFPEYAESVPGGESTAMLSSVAKENKIWLIGGSVSERTADGRIYNTCAVFNPSGNLVAKHRKVHLFDIDVPGKITFKESDTLTGGDGITVFDTPFGRVGVGICYDIRFPELAQLMREKGAVILAYPGVLVSVHQYFKLPCYH